MYRSWGYLYIIRKELSCGLVVPADTVFFASLSRFVVEAGGKFGYYILIRMVFVSFLQKEQTIMPVTICAR